jgi:hypothetical protein
LLVLVAVYSAPQVPVDWEFGAHEARVGRVEHYWRLFETADDLKKMAGEEALYSGLSVTARMELVWQ